MTRPSFVTLEDFVTGAGVPLHKVLEGDASAAKNASAALVSKDPSGNLKYLEQASDGSLKVTQGGALAYLRAAASGASATGVSTVLTIALTANRQYRGLDVSVSCRRNAEFYVMWNDNGTMKILDSLDVGPGNQCESYSKGNHAFQSGTGTQQIIVTSQCGDTPDVVKAAVAVTEVQV